ncbi:MAG: hypothetical protein K6B40_07655 [Firmicutes bacterium]|nr:hypothetical protein [Bacillota bacterium]
MRRVTYGEGIFWQIGLIDKESPVSEEPEPAVTQKATNASAEADAENAAANADAAKEETSSNSLKKNY